MHRLKLIVNAEKRCNAKGSKLTDKRRKILQSLLKSDSALSAYEIIERYNTQYSETILAMSAYRILDFLEKECLIHKLSTVNKYIGCSCITDCKSKHKPSQFFICTTCSRVEETSINKLIYEQLLLNIKKFDFELTSPQLEINCTCKNCR